MAMHSATVNAGIPSVKGGSPRRGVLHAVLAGIGRAFGAIGFFLESLVASQQASARYERLTRMNEAELAAHGIKREDIPRYVYEQAFRHS